MGAALAGLISMAEQRNAAVGKCVLCRDGPRSNYTALGAIKFTDLFPHRVILQLSHFARCSPAHEAAHGCITGP